MRRRHETQIQQCCGARKRCFVEADVTSLVLKVEVILLARDSLKRTPLAIFFRRRFVSGSRALGGPCSIDRINGEVHAGHRKIGERTILKAGDKTGDYWLILGYDRHFFWSCTGDELVHLSEGGWVESQFAVVEVREDYIVCSAQRRSFEGNVRRSLRSTEGDPCRLSILIELIAAKCHHLDA